MLTFIAPHITLLYAGILGLMFFALSVYVVRWRWIELKGLGCDQDPKSGLFRAVRIHGNFAEYVPFILLLITLDEMTGRLPWMTHAMGIALIIARLAHFQGIRKSHGTSPGRGLSVALTFGLLLILSVLLILKGIL
jgi:uncharacterized protein